MYMLQKILRRLTLRYQQLKLCIRTLILWKNDHNTYMYMYNIHISYRKICRNKPAEHTTNDALLTNNPVAKAAAAANGKYTHVPSKI